MRGIEYVMVVVFLFWGSYYCYCSGQDERGGIDAISRFLGDISPEDMDTEDVERLEGYLSKPLQINKLNVDRLVESGLFSQYQAVSIVDYRDNHGDILSMTELGTVDGIGQLFALKVAPFVCFSGDLQPNRRYIRVEAKTRAGLKCLFDGTLHWSSAARLSLAAGERLETGLSMSKTLSGKLEPQALAGNLTYHCARVPMKFVMGDFSARFGQGLALWSGMGINGVSAPISMVKRPSGIAGSKSFSADYSLTGTAMQYSSKHLRVSAAIALPGVRRINRGPNYLGVMPLADFTWFGSNTLLSVTGYLVCKPFNKTLSGKNAIASINGPCVISDAKTSISQRLIVRGTELFAELSYDWINRVPAGLAGVLFRSSDDLRLAIMLRYYPLHYASTYSTAARSRTKCCNEHSMSFTGEFSSGKYFSFGFSGPYTMPSKRFTGTFFLDLSHIPRPEIKKEQSGYQLKTGVNCQFVFCKFLAVKMRAVERFRSCGERFRSELRADILLYFNDFYASTRINAVYCNKIGILGFVEGGYRHDCVSVYLRSGLFRIDSWQDRIYVYERDSPGAFNVPAFYGRGVWAAMTCAWKFARWGKFYVRMATTAYPFATEQKKKPGNAELKFQLNVSF